MQNLILPSSKLIAVLRSLDSQKWVVIKKSKQFPNYLKGSDIDLYVQSLDMSIELLVKALSPFIENGYSHLTVNRYSDKAHIDLISNGEIELRFDLQGQMPAYSALKLKPAFFADVLHSRLFDKEVGIYVPSKENELVLRYMEYLEYFNEYPDKIRHLEFVLRELDHDPALNDRFLFKVHMYLEKPFNEAVKKKRILDFSYIKQMYLKSLELYRQKGAVALFSKVISKLFG